MSKKERPEFCTDEYLEYLDELRESGDTNMYGAGAWLLDAFPELSKTECSAILGYWMESFSERHSITS